MSAIFTILIILFSIVIHEVAHGYAAYLLGDDTAYYAGRLTLNPIPHIDPIGSVAVPLLAFLTAGTFLGWAKPVPVNTYNLKGRYSDAIVSGAGIFANIMIAFVCGVLYKYMIHSGMLNDTLATALFTVIGVNVSLAFFNLIPVPPFDGMAILQGLFPRMKVIFSFMYNPAYLILAIMVASVFYSAFIPVIFKVISGWLV